MSAERRDAETVREFQLDGLGLLVAAAVLLGLLGGAFFAGRWVERRSRPAAAAAAPADPLAGVADEAPYADVKQGMDHFDRAGGSATAEPRREARPSPRPADEPSEPSRSAEVSGLAPVEPAPAEGSGLAAEPAPPAADPLAGASDAVPLPSGPADASGAFWVQITASHDAVAVEALAHELRGAGYRVSLLPEAGGSLVRVRVGGYASREEARQAAEELKKRGYPGAWVPSGP